MAKAAAGLVPGSRNKTTRRIKRRNAQLLAAVSAAFAAMAGAPVAHAEGDESAAAPLEDIVVTAQKRTENLQEVPLSITALGSEKLEELHVTGLDDYVRLVPSLSYVRSQGEGGNGQPGTSHLYIRGVVSGGDGNHSGSLPSVGMYLDEQPVTTIDGNIDVHIYDIERIEVLEGPQGTLYGASSEAGTVRIITNKPDPSKFAAGYDLDFNVVKHGGFGHTEEGFINLPIAKNAAIRLVGWDEHDAGFIDNVAGTNAAAGIIDGVRTFPSWNAGNGGLGTIGAGAITNAPFRKDHYNTVDTKGGRGALKFDLNDSWTITPSFMAQNVKTNGFFAYDPVVGDLQVAHFGPEGSTDSFAQGALTIEGKIQDFDIVYAGSYFKRDDHTVSEYSDYSFFYDKLFGSGKYFVDNAGKLIDPQQKIIGDDWFYKTSHELRVSTPKKYAVKATVGAFIETQRHDIYQNYLVPGLNGDGLTDAISVPGWPHTIWLTDEERVDKDRAIFAQATWDIDPHWALTGGLRQFWYDNSLVGFYGFSSNWSTHEGTATCGPNGGAHNPTYAPFHGAPCTDLNGEVTGSGHSPLLTLTHFGDDDKMVYFTVSRGFRPGGVNRAQFPGTNVYVPPYKSDYLNNFELGWKTLWADKRVKWNAAVFRENWNNFQFSFLVPPSLTAIANAPNAHINGMESDLEWSLKGGLMLSANMTLTDGKLTQDYCNFQSTCGSSGNPVVAHAGTRLPVTPLFKGDFVARYNFKIQDWKSDVQAAYTFQTQTTPLLTNLETQLIGTQPAYGLLNLSVGGEINKMSLEAYISNVLDTRAQLSRFTECLPTTCSQTYIVPSNPLTIGIKFGQKF